MHTVPPGRRCSDALAHLDNSLHTAGHLHTPTLSPHILAVTRTLAGAAAAEAAAAKRTLAGAAAAANCCC